MGRYRARHEGACMRWHYLQPLSVTHVVMPVQVPGGRRGYETWRYKGGYWEARESGNWDGIRHIYGDGPKGFTAPELLY